MQPEVLKLLGVKDLETALKEFDKEGKKAMDKSINKAANTIKIHAKTYIKDDSIPGLSRWKDAARFTVRTQNQVANNVRIPTPKDFQQQLQLNKDPLLVTFMKRVELLPGMAHAKTTA
jgi:hypothetical protein